MVDLFGLMIDDGVRLLIAIPIEMRGRPGRVGVIMRGVLSY